MVNNTEFAIRLQKIREEYELSTTSFAEKINVGRATINHILSGRNRPSLDFVMKVVHSFPEVDLYWLLNGKGHFPKSTSSNEHEIKPEVVVTIPELNEFESPIGTSSEKPSSQLDQNALDNITKTSNTSKIKRIILFFEDGSFETYS